MPVSASRTLGLACAALIALLAIREYATLEAEVTRLQELASSVDDPDLLTEVGRQTDPIAARLVVARGLVGIEADPETFQQLSGEERHSRALTGVEILRVARQLSLEALESRPASWQAHLLVGASTFLESVRASTSNPDADHHDWERSLLLAHELAPSRSEPVRFLSAAYLSDWSRLDQEQRMKALPILETAFRDSHSLELLLPQWLRVAPSLETALTVLPDTFATWRQVARYHANRGDWERFCLASEQGEKALLRELLEETSSAANQLRIADRSGARMVLHSVIDRSPVYAPFDTVLTEFLRLYPPGLASSRTAAKLRKWLEWSTQRCLHFDCRLEPALVARLASLAELEHPARIAEASILAGDLARAEVYERRSLQPGALDWRAYLLLKTRLLAERGNRAEARATLSLVPQSQRALPEYRLTDAFLEAAEEDWRASQRLESRSAESAWTKDGNTWLMMLPGNGTDHMLEIEIEVVSPDTARAPVQILWNGRHAEYHTVSSATRLRFKPASWLPLNTLSLVQLENTRLQPGPTRHAGSAAAAPRPPIRAEQPLSPHSPAS